jgi:amino acid transporter
VGRVSHLVMAAIRPLWPKWGNNFLVAELMNFLGALFASFFTAIIMLIVVFLTIACFAEAFRSRPDSGSFAIAGAIMVGASILALARLTSSGRR